MPRTIGIWAAEHIAAGLVEDERLVGPLWRYPQEPEDRNGLQGMPAESIVRRICEEIHLARQGELVEAVGVGFPGIILGGIVEESPNLQQVKGFHLQAALSSTLSEAGVPAPVLVMNDADAMAAGVAATQGHLEKFIRVWTLGDGIGFGRHPRQEGVWEGGHSVVSLDLREQYCGCGGMGHLEGIMGSRAMRRRFLDLEPDEVFENAKAGDARCADFVRLWHGALAAATATSIHMDGGGRFFLGGPNARYLDIALLNRYVHEMVKMSPLQDYVFEVFSSSDEIGVIGAAVTARRHISTG